MTDDHDLSRLVACSMMEGLDDEAVKLAALEQTVPADEHDLAEVLARAFDPAQLEQLHAAAAAGPDTVAGKGPLAARGMRSEAWTTLTTALAIALERARHPMRTVVVDEAVPGDSYQVFLDGIDVPLTVIVKADGDGPGDGYRSTIVPHGHAFELPRGEIEEVADLTWPPALILRSVAPTTMHTPVEEEQP